MASFEPSGVVTLLTDFGVTDPFVGVMKGVIASRAPGARVIDLAHGIEPQNVIEAAFWLSNTYVWFPPGTVHVAVVDPGVGSARSTVVTVVNGHAFVAPDNGLLGPVLADAGDAPMCEIDASVLGVERLSATFHGRDLFSPAGAELASGRIAPADIGPAKTAVVPSAYPLATADDGRIAGTIVAVDHFGNLISNITASEVHVAAADRVEIAGHECKLRHTYADARRGELVAVINSWDTLEVAVREGNARAQLGVAHGTTVTALR